MSEFEIENKFKELMNDKSLKRIMSLASNRFVKLLDIESITQCCNIALWETILETEKNANTNFNAVLYNKVKWGCCDEISRQRNSHFSKIPTQYLDKSKNRQRHAVTESIANDITIDISLLPKELSEILSMYMLGGKTMTEIAKHTRISRNTIAKKIKMGISMLRK